MDKIKFYHSKAWERKRAAVLKRDGYMCRISKRYGKHREAQTVHHIFPLDEYPEYRLESWNLISLSTEVHNKMHDRITNDLTEAGKDLLRKTARARGMEIPERYKT